MKPRAALWRMAITALVAGISLVLIMNVVNQPVAANTRSYIAEFTDASGLHVDADVRVRGVRVGKVRTVELERRAGQSIAAVGFTLDSRYGVVSQTRLAVKYQALTGVRYVDISDPAEKYTAAELVTHVPTTRTQPSFDITALFNGLQPVIATLSPDEINTFAANAVAYLSGDGGGLAPMLDSIRKLTEFVSNRQEVVATLMRNLAEVSDEMGGHSKELIKILQWLNIPVDAILSVLDELRKSQIFGPEFTGSALQLLRNAGFRYGVSVDNALDRALLNMDNFIESFKLVPFISDNIEPPSQIGAPVPCSRGRAQLPEQMDVLINGQKVILCKK